LREKLAELFLVETRAVSTDVMEGPGILPLVYVQKLSLGKQYKRQGATSLLGIKRNSLHHHSRLVPKLAFRSGVMLIIRQRTA
jgi:hypothetical protein